MKPGNNRWVHYAVLLAAVCIAYGKVLQAGFISWDDADYVLNNPDIRSFSNVSLWFSKFYIGNYHPLTLFSYAIDFAIGGRNPFVYHLTNVLLHAANVLLVYAVSKKLLNHAAVAFFIALLFAVHPVQTESISWVAERKNVLFGLFFLLALYYYIAYATEDSNKKLIIVILAGAAAMLSKAAAVTLPVTLLAVDIALQRPLNNKKVWLEKLPLLLIAVAAGIVAIEAQDAGEFLNLHPEYNWGHKLVFAGYAYTAYIVQLLLPVKLSVLYPYPSALSAQHYIFAAVSAGIILSAYIAYRKQWYILCAGIVFYTVNIAIVLQFVQFGEVLMADRYLYVACVGIWMILVYYVFLFFGKRSQRIIAFAGAGVLSLLLLITTFKRNDIWLSELNFWSAIVETFPNSSVAQNSIGGVYMSNGNYPQALSHIEAALAADPANASAWYNKGAVHLRMGNEPAAQQALDRAISINEHVKALFTRAMLLQQQGQVERALIDIDKVLEKQPENARAYFIKGSCMEQLSNAAAALEAYSNAIKYGNNDPLFYTRRGALYVRKGEYAAAISDLSMAISLKNDAAEAWYWRGLAKHSMGKEPCGDLNEARKYGYEPSIAALMKICNAD